MGGILALDQATVCGWAFAELGQEPVWGHKRLGSEHACYGESGAALCVLVEARIKVYHPELIVYETPFLQRNVKTTRKLFGYAFLIDTLAALQGIKCWELQSTAFTNFMTGRGKYGNRAAKKRAVQQACWARGWKTTEDEADALGLLLYAESKLYPEAAYARKRVFKPISGPLFAETAA